jgi:hypothetical protein
MPLCTSYSNLFIQLGSWAGLLHLLEGMMQNVSPACIIMPSTNTAGSKIVQGASFHHSSNIHHLTFSLTILSDHRVPSVKPVTFMSEYVSIVLTQCDAILLYKHHPLCGFLFRFISAS